MTNEEDTMTEEQVTRTEERVDKFGKRRGNGVCRICGGLGVLRCKPWKPGRETMTCWACDSEHSEHDPDRMSAEEYAAMQPAAGEAYAKFLPGSRGVGHATPPADAGLITPQPGSAQGRDSAESHAPPPPADTGEVEGEARVIRETYQQACPICQGHGVVPQGFYSYPAGQAFGSTHTGPERCQNCHTTGVVTQTREITEPRHA